MSNKQSDLDDNFVHVFTQARSMKGWNMQDFYDQSGMHPSTIHRAMKNPSAMKIQTLEFIADVLGIHPTAFWGAK